MHRSAVVICVLAASVCFITHAGAAGLSSTFSEVKIENLSIGTSYSTTKEAGLPLNVVNTGDEPIDLKVDILLPEQSELKEGFEPIPDIGWITLENDEFKGVKPKDSAIADVNISIPDDPKYLGKKYQVFIWSHTIGKRIGVGLKSKLLITIKE